MFSRKQYVHIVATHQVRVYSAGTASTEPGTGTGLREIDISCQRSSVPSKLLKDSPKMVVSCFLVFKQERVLPS